MAEIEPRERWAKRSSFILAALGSAIGLGNLWRFPTMAAQYGGGAFLIPYFIALFTAGIPLLIVEFGMGQMFQRSAPSACARANKKFEWVGWWSLACGFVITAYYCVIMSWSLNYLVHSFNVAWSPAGKGEDYPVTFFKQDFLRVAETGGDPGHILGVVLPIVLGLAVTWIAIYWIIAKGVSRVGKVVLITVPTPFILLVILFIRSIMLPGAATGMDYYLTPNFSRIFDVEVWLAAYGQVFFSLSIGFGALMAYASFLPRRADVNNNAFITALGDCGTSFFAGLVVFSVIGFLAFAQAEDGFKPESIVGGKYAKQLEALAKQDPAKLDATGRGDYEILRRIAQNKKDGPVQVSALDEKLIRDGLTKEEVRGYVTREAAASKGVAPEAVTEDDLRRKATEIVADDSGPGLAFQLFPIAISRMPGIWKVVVGILFFLMLLSLGIDSAFSLVEAIVSGLNDKFGFNRVKSTLIVCIASFLLGVVFCTYAGVLWLDIVDRWINSYGLVAVGLFEALLIGWFYKTAKFKKHVNKYSDIKIGLWWDICIKVITPVILIGTLVLSIIGELSKNYEGYPLWSLIVGGWLMVAAVLGSGWLFMMMRGNKGNNQAAAQNEEK